MNIYIEASSRPRDLFSFPYHTIRVDYQHSRISILSLSTILRFLPRPCQSFVLCVNFNHLSLPTLTSEYSFRHSFNYPSKSIYRSIHNKTEAAMFKRSHRSKDRVEKNIKSKKSYRDPAKLSKLQKSFEQSAQDSPNAR